jgi:hypothetical protein
MVRKKTAKKDSGSETEPEFKLHPLRKRRVGPPVLFPTEPTSIPPEKIIAAVRKVLSQPPNRNGKR